MGFWCLVLALHTSCASVIRQAVSQDMIENTHDSGAQAYGPAQEDDSPLVCPPDKVQHEDCRVSPCKVTCDDPQKPPR